MDAEKELVQIAEEMQVEIIQSMERALLKIAAKKIGGTMAQKIISFSLVYCWTLWLQQLTPGRRAKLFEMGCDTAASKLLELAREEKSGFNLNLN